MQVAVPRKRTTTNANDDEKNGKADKARPQATMTIGKCSKTDHRTIGHCKRAVGEQPLQVARSPRQPRERLRADCKHDVHQQPKTSYHPYGHVEIPDPNSNPNGELMTDGPRARHPERSSGLLVVRTAETRTEQQRTEGVKICHDRRFSGKEEKCPTHTQKGDVNSCTQGSKTEEGT